MGGFLPLLRQWAFCPYGQTSSALRTRCRIKGRGPALDNGNVVFEPQNATVGFIFYPGVKVEANAYQPLMAELAREGVLCVLVEMPFNLAVFDINAGPTTWTSGLVVAVYSMP